MVNLHYPKNQQQVRFSLDVSGRQFPTADRALDVPLDTSGLPSESIELAEDVRKLRDRLITSIRLAVTSLEEIRTATSTKQVTLAYQAAMGQLGQVQSQWQALVREVAVFELELNDRALASQVAQSKALNELEEWKEEVLGCEALKPIALPPCLTAELASGPVPRLVETLVQNVEGYICRLADRFVEQLFTLVDVQVVGLVQWFGSTACTYHRFYRTLSTDVIRKDEPLGKLQRLPNGRMGWILRSIEQGTNTRRLFRHVQHVLEAVKLQPSQATIVIPQRQSDLIERIPSWLLDQVQLIEGDLIRELVITQDLAVREWTHQHDRILYHRDPAIVLGPFVLTAWGPTEIQAELQAQNDDKMRAENLSRLCSGGIALAIAACFCWLSGFIPSLSLLALVACIAASYILGMAAIREPKAKDDSEKIIDRPAEWALRLYAMTASGAVAIAFFGLATDSWLKTIVFGLIAGVLGWLYFRQLQKFGLPPRRLGKSGPASR